ncbi:MAG: ABC transporter ATP-binding protein [Eubacteriales bacterium]|jgi:putative spermidine/putrescine transport system ATP-binding protein
MAYIKFDHITKSFGKKEVLRDISLDIEKGDLVTLLGPSGCGKSTLLRCLAGLESVTGGRIFLDGKDITNMEPQKRGIGMVFQQYSLFPNMTVEQNVIFGLKMKKTPDDVAKKKTEDIIKIVGLTEQKKQYPSQLSGGQQQRAALARALVTEPKVLLLDEPLSAIDALLRHSLQIEIRRIQQELGITAIFVTHDQDEAMVMSDVINLMYEGRIEQSARPIDLYTNPKTKFAASFIGHYNLLTADEMKTVTGETIESENIAFRPELLQISTKASDAPDCYQMKGKISFSLPHGNILRYAVIVNGKQIDTDVLFGTSDPFNNGDEVYLTIPKKECIYL